MSLSTSSVVALDALGLDYTLLQVAFIRDTRHFCAECLVGSPDWCWRPVGSASGSPDRCRTVRLRRPLRLQSHSLRSCQVKVMQPSSSSLKNRSTWCQPPSGLEKLQSAERQPQ